MYIATNNNPYIPMAQQPEYAVPSARPQRTPYAFGTGDAVFGVIALALGFLFWEWKILSMNVNCFAFIMVLIVCTLVYMRKKCIAQNMRSLVCLAVLIAGSLPFLIYDDISIHDLLFLFDATVFLIWLTLTCRTGVSKTVSGYVASDLINQGLLVSFGNFGGIFGGIRSGMKNAKNGKVILGGVIGALIAIPVIAGVLSLLISADSGFEMFTDRISEMFAFDRMGMYVLEFVVGVPVACYIYGLIYGNTHERQTRIITKSATERSINIMHVIPTVSIYVPVAILSAIYIIFFVVMAPYLFSAFGGALPEGYTYSEYARRGFFELCGVAAINLGVLIVAYLFAKREPGEYPKTLRILTGALSVLTVLLIITAASKMFLYIDAYGLSRLRVYTLWFMALLLVVFAILIIWHFKPFNAGTPIVLAFTAAVLALFLTNTDGLIAKYNVENYLNGNLPTVDVDMMMFMSDAVVPHLRTLEAQSEDAEIKSNAANMIDFKRIIVTHDGDEYELGGASYTITEAFSMWNLQTKAAFGE